MAGYYTSSMIPFSKEKAKSRLALLQRKREQREERIREVPPYSLLRPYSNKEKSSEVSFCGIACPFYRQKSKSPNSRHLYHLRSVGLKRWFGHNYWNQHLHTLQKGSNEKNTKDRNDTEGATRILNLVYERIEFI